MNRLLWMWEVWRTLRLKPPLLNTPIPSWGQCFSGRRPKKDGNGHYFIDRDGGLFKHVLNFLRCKTLCLPTDFKETSQLIEEASFYQIQPMINELMTPEVKTTPPAEKGIYLLVKDIRRKDRQGSVTRKALISGSKGMIDEVPTEVRERLDCIIKQNSHFGKLATHSIRQQCAQILKGIGFTFIKTYFSKVSEEGALVEVFHDKWFCPYSPVLCL